jgi:Cu+-exporting ATPase
MNMVKLHDVINIHETINMITTNNVKKSVLYGILASAILLGVYFAVLTLVSGWSYALSQFAGNWYFIVSLVAGFGIQIVLYQYIKGLVYEGRGMGKVVGVSGTTSTAAMISCCAHYLVNLIPILGVTGFATLVSQYQTKIYWIGLAFNIFGIIFISSKIIKFKKEHGSR